MEEQESIGAKKVSLTPLTTYVERESKRDRFPNLSPRKRKDISIGKERTSFYLLIFGKNSSVSSFSHVGKKQFFLALRC